MFSFEIFELDWPLVTYHLSHLLFAYLLALPIGWEREQSKRHFGLRTGLFFILRRLRRVLAIHDFEIGFHRDSGLDRAILSHLLRIR